MTDNRMLDQNLFNERIGVGKVDLICIKDKHHPGFSLIEFTNSLNQKKIGESDVLEKRAFLINKLNTDGLEVKLIKGERSEVVVFRAEYAHWTVYINVFTTKNKPIAYLSCQTKEEPNRRGYIQKEYVVSDQEKGQFENLGIMQVATSLAIEVIKYDVSTPTDVIGGTTNKNNIASIFSRLHTPNITEGGYYREELVDLGRDWNMLTHIYESVPLGEIRNVHGYSNVNK